MTGSRGVRLRAQLTSLADTVQHRLLRLETAGDGKWDRLAGYLAPVVLLLSLGYFMTRAWRFTRGMHEIEGVILAVLIEFAAFILAFVAAFAALTILQLLTRVILRLGSGRST